MFVKVRRIRVMEHDMWVNEMMTIWAVGTIFFLSVIGFSLWKWYG